MSLPSTLIPRPVQVTDSTDARLADRWPHIHQFLRVKAGGWIEHDYVDFYCWEDTLSPTELVAANEELADFYEWRLVARADQLAGDRNKRNLVEQRTADLAYTCRRAATYARGQDPGEWVPLWKRRPDLVATGCAIVAEIIADLNADNHKADRRLVAR